MFYPDPHCLSAAQFNPGQSCVPARHPGRHDASRDHDAITTTRSQAAALLAKTKRFYAQRPVARSSDTLKALRREIAADTDVMLDFMMKSFPGKADKGRLSDLLGQGSEIDVVAGDCEVDEDPALLPVAIMRELLHRHRMPLDTKSMVNFRRFSERYASVLMAA